VVSDRWLVVREQRAEKRVGRKGVKGMKLTKDGWMQVAGCGAEIGGDGERGSPSLGAKTKARRGWGSLLLMAVCAAAAAAQAVSTTTVQGTVYLANGQAGSGTLVVSWPSFTTAAGQAVAADKLNVTIGSDGFVSVNLAPNQGATPAGEFHTAVFYLSDGTVSTQYWVVPAAAQASLAQVQAQVMPAAQAVQAVSKAYVDQAIAAMSSQLSGSGGTLTGPLYLNADPTQPMQAATKHYVDSQVATALPLSGGTVTGAFTAKQIGAAYQVDQFTGADFGAKLQACIGALSTTYGGTCDARNFTGNLSMGSSVTIATGNVSILLPCATIATANQIVVTAGTRNVALHGCAVRGGSAASGSQGGTAFAYSGAGALVQIGDPTYAVDTPGFHMDNAVINTTGATAAAAQGLAAYRTQEMDLEDMYFLGNSNQTGMTLDGTGNYTGGTFRNNQFSGFQIAVNAIGHQITNPATTDWLNASTFIRLHIDCPTSGGNPISGTYGVNLQQGDGNTFTGGDVEGCATTLHLGPNAQNNTILGLRNENSTNQVVADAGSSYNSWITGGTMLTGKLTDNGTRNSFLDTFHRSFNGLNGDWYGSQQDATLTNHFRLGIGTGNERGLQDRYQTDYGYRWTMGLSDATGGEQFYQILDELNNVYRFSIGQYNNGQSSTNNQTVINSAGTGAVVLNGSNGSGTGGVIFGSGGTSENTVATINNAGNAQFNGTLLVGGTSQSTGTMTVRNNADAEVDYYLWPGLTASQKGSYTYKDWNGNSQWYLVKDASNNWALNSATGGLDSFKAYQSTNSGDTYIDTSNSSGHIRLNYETGSGAETDIYSGSSSSLDAAFLGPTSIKFPGLAAATGHACLQVDTSGYLTNTGSACGSGSGGTSGTINSGSTGQIAYYTANGTTVGGMNAVPVSAGGTGATTAAAALAGLGGVAASGGTMTGALTAPGFNGPLAGNVTGTASGNLLPANNLSDVASAPAAVSNLLPGVASDGNQGVKVQGVVTEGQTEPQYSPYADIRAFGATIDGATDIGAAVQAAVNSFGPNAGYRGHSNTVLLPCAGLGNGGGCYWDNPSTLTVPWGTVKFLLQGELQLGSMLVAGANEEWHGDASGYGTQFQNGIPGVIVSEQVTGTVGTAVATSGAPATITPSFTNGNIAHLPVGASMAIAGLGSASATAVRSNPGTTGYGLAVFTLTGSTLPRFVVGEIATITGCSDSSFNVANIAISNVDYVAKTVTIWQTTTTASTATGCTITSLNLDSRESVRILCANGTAGTFNGTTYNQCGAGQVTIYPRLTHSASDQFAENAAGPAFNSYNPQVWDSLSIQNCYGDCFDAEGSTNFYMKGMSFAPMGTFTAGSLHLRSSGYFGQIHNSVMGTTNLGQSVPPCPSGSCSQPSIPYGLILDADPPGLFYGSANAAGGLVRIDDNSVVYGGVLATASALPMFDKTIFEEPPNAAVTIDNRSGGGNLLANCLVIEHSLVQDAVYDEPQYWVSYTDLEAAGGCVEFNDLNMGSASALTNAYYNGTVHTQGTPGISFVYPLNASSPSGNYLMGNAIAGEVEGIGSAFGPSVLPFGSLAINTSPSYWAGICATYNDCTVTNVVGPDGPGGKIQAGELDNVSTNGGGIPIGTWSGATYAGDHFIYGTWLKPGANRPFPVGYAARGSAFELSTQGTDTFAGQTNPSAADPGAFGTRIANNGWYPQVAVATIATGQATTHNITFGITAGQTGGDPTGAGNGNQFAQPFWAFVPGPNNPACTAAGTCNLTIDQIVKAQRDQYHGCVPPNLPAGATATCEAVNEGSTTTGSVTITGAPSGSYVKADGTGYGTPSSVTSFNTRTGSVTLTAADVDGVGAITNSTTGNAATATALAATPTLCGSGQAAQGISANGSAAGCFTPSGTGITQLTGDVTAGPGGGSQAATVVKINGGSVPASAALLGTNASAQPLAVTALPASAFPALTGDVTNTAGTLATTVGKVNGGSIPASAAVIGTNSSQQVVTATAAQIVAAIGSTAVASATSAASFTGALSGDVTGTQSATSVVKVNGGSVPASANVVATNGSGQLAAGTAHNESAPRNCATTNSGNAYSCTTAPTFTPAAGDTISININAANSGSATLAVNGGAAATIKKWGNSSTLAANDLLAGHWISATYDGTYWQLEGQLGNANATQVNGGALPANASLVGTNSSSQIQSVTSVSASLLPAATSSAQGAVQLASGASGNILGSAAMDNTGTSGANVPLLNGANTWSASTTTYANNAAATDFLIVQPGTSSTAESGGLQLNSAATTPVAEWQIEEDTSYDLLLYNSGASTPMAVLTAYSGGATNVSSQGTGAVTVNNVNHSGSGGFIVYEGGANYNTAALTVNSSGNTTATGFLQGKFYIGSSTMTLTAGAAAGTSPSIACTTNHVCDGASGTVTLTTGTSPTTGTLATLGFPNTHTNYANCIVAVQSASAVLTTDTWTESTTAITITANSAPAASTAYTVRYWCGGN